MTEPTGDGAPAVATMTLAILDPAGVFQGLETVPEGDVPANRVRVPAECDLEPGRARWNAEGQHFSIIRPPEPDAPDTLAPEALTAIAETIVAVDAGKRPASGAVAWAKRYLASFDAKTTETR